MSVRPIGPGPGAYGLPTTIGFNDHDVRKQRMPQYSIRVKTGQIDKRVSPGPGIYNTANMTRHGCNAVTAYTMGHLYPHTDKETRPGPADHEVHLKPHFKGTNAPAYSMVFKNNYNRNKNTNPGPNIYYHDMKPTKPGIPAYTMGLQTKTKDEYKSPGPAAYAGIDPNIKLNRSPAYTMRPLDHFKYKNNTPGANVYNLSGYKPGKRGADYTFGVKHHQYAPPMIVECDNETEN